MDLLGGPILAFVPTMKIMGHGICKYLTVSVNHIWDMGRLTTTKIFLYNGGVCFAFVGYKAVGHCNLVCMFVCLHRRSVKRLGSGSILRAYNSHARVSRTVLLAVASRPTQT